MPLIKNSYISVYRLNPIQRKQITYSQSQYENSLLVKMSKHLLKLCTLLTVSFKHMRNSCYACKTSDICAQMFSYHKSLIIIIWLSYNKTYS